MRFSDAFSRLAAVLISIPALALAACSGGDDEPAVPAPYESGFDGSQDTTSWLFWDPSDTNTPPGPSVPTLWSFDATPSDMPGGAYLSGPSSLNYNNGASYDVGTSSGVAISPKLDIGAMTAPILVFKCNYETETTGTAYDQRHVKIGYLDSNLQPVYHLEAQLSTSPGNTDAGACAAMGTWHEHVIALDPGWGQIRFGFGFDSVDDFDNAWKGWFIDDFQVIEAADYVPWGGGTGGGSGGSGGGGSGSGAYTTDFDSPGSTVGWAMGGTGVAWSVDGSPSAVAGGAYQSAPSSLNYNDGSTYDNGVPNAGTATSPAIDLTGQAAPVLKFACNFQTESDATVYDQRWVSIVDAATDAVLWAGQLAGSGGSAEAGPCSSMGTWHTHTIPLNPAWGVIKAQFVFDSVDEWDNAYAGWFVDDVLIGDPSSGGSGGGAGGGSSGPTIVSNDGIDHAGGDGCSGAAGSRARPLAFGWVLGLAILALRRRSP